MSFSGAPGGHQGVCASVVLCGFVNDQPVFGPIAFHTVPWAHPCGDLHPILHPVPDRQQRGDVILLCLFNKKMCIKRLKSPLHIPFNFGSFLRHFTLQFNSLVHCGFYRLQLFHYIHRRVYMGGPKEYIIKSLAGSVQETCYKTISIYQFCHFLSMKS